VINPPTPVPGIDVPSALTAPTLATETDAEVSCVPAAMVRVTVARTPLLIALSFTPNTEHRMLPRLLEHVTLLPAAVATTPGVTVTPETSDAR